MAIQVDEAVMEGVVNHIEATSKMLEKQAQVDAEVAKRGPEVVESLIKAGFINEKQRAGALEAVKDPLKVLDSLHKIAQASATPKAAAVPSLGKAAGDEHRDAAPETPTAMRGKRALEDANRRFLSSFGFGR